MKQVGLGDSARDLSAFDGHRRSSRARSILEDRFEPTDWVAIFLKSYERAAWPSAWDQCHGYRAIAFSGGSAR